MTGRERLIEVGRGQAADRRPVICWPGELRAESDARVVGWSEIASHAGRDERLLLAEVVNPFGRVRERNLGLSDMLAEDPSEGAKLLDGLVEETRGEMAEALRAGADGILYRLHGARALHTTPMQYGGHYLEPDRELLKSIGEASFNLLFVVGEEDLYLDFVSDLPAHAFGWDSAASEIGVAAVRQMRPGPLATNAPDSDIELRFPFENPSRALDSVGEEHHV